VENIHRFRTLPPSAAVPIAAAGALAGVGFVSGLARPLLLSAGVVGTLVLGYLAMTRIAAFALVLLAVRSSLDITSIQASGTRGGSSGVPATAVSLLLIFAVSLWVPAQRRVGEALPALSIAGIAVAVTAVLSSVGSIEKAVTIIEAARVTSAAAMLVLLVGIVRTRKQVRSTLRVVYVSAVVPFVVAAWQVASAGSTAFKDASRIVGTFSHPNAFGAYLALLLVAGVAFVQSVKGVERRVLQSLLIVGFGLLVLTFSRGSWIATVLGLIVVAVVQRRPSVIGLLIGVMAVAATVPAVWVRLSDLGEIRSLSGGEGNSLVWRFDFWRETLQFADRNPATGIGLDMAQVVMADGNLPHNDFIRMYVEAGWLGLTALLALLCVLVATAWRAMAIGVSDPERAVGAGFSGSLTVIIIVMVGGNVISTVVLLWYFFAIAACAHAVSRGWEPSTAADDRELRSPI